MEEFDVVINVGDADTAQSGGENWIDETISYCCQRSLSTMAADSSE